MNGFVLTIEQWALVFGALMPILVGVVTKARAGAGLKSAVLLLLELITGLLTDFFASPNGFDWQGALVNAGVAWATGVVAYHGLWKHTVAPKVIDATARFGVGTNDVGWSSPGRRAA